MKIDDLLFFSSFFKWFQTLESRVQNLNFLWNRKITSHEMAIMEKTNQILIHSSLAVIFTLKFQFFKNINENNILKRIDDFFRIYHIIWFIYESYNMTHIIKNFQKDITCLWTESPISRTYRCLSRIRALDELLFLVSSHLIGNKQFLF